MGACLMRTAAETTSIPTKTTPRAPLLPPLVDIENVRARSRCFSACCEGQVSIHHHHPHHQASQHPNLEPSSSPPSPRDDDDDDADIGQLGGDGSTSPSSKHRAAEESAAAWIQGAGREAAEAAEGEE